MSYAAKIKQELADSFPQSRNARISEAAVIFAACGKIDESGRLEVKSENELPVRKYFTLLKKTFIIDDKFLKMVNSGGMYAASLNDVSLVQKVKSEFNEINAKLDDVNCKRAYLRGLFLACGTMSEPESAYSMEYSLTDGDFTAKVLKFSGDFSIDFKLTERKGRHIAYLKEGEQISDMLNVLGAPKAMMDFENVMILKDVRNNVNRKVNCETANINKMVKAAQKKIDDILYIKDRKGLDILPEDLREIAVLRIENPESSLAELGGMLKEKLGKSGVSHRLDKISVIAERLASSGAIK